MRNNHTQQHKGFALLLAVIVSSVVLAIGVSILNISISQITLSSTARESEFAFQAAHAGVDCAWYWRNEYASVYESATGGIPDINCFGETNEPNPVRASISSNPPAGSDGHITSYSYLFNWGSPQHCTSIEMIVMNAHDTELSVTFENEAVGDDGIKECAEGNVCTVLFSRGYNRSCGELDSSIFSVQRELTVEF